MKLSAVMARAVADLRDLGVDAADDPNHVPIPGAWVTVRRIRPRVYIDGTAVVELVVYLLAGDYAGPPVLDKLQQMAELVEDMSEPGEPIEAVTLALPNYAPAGLPALAVPVHYECTPDTESEDEA